MPFNLPNALTWLRILLIPVFLLFYYLPEAWMERQSVNLTAAAIFGLAAMTDWLDGYLARKLNQMSAFGAFLDPVADKLMVAAALILLLQLGRVDAIVALIIIGREIAISALREWMAGVGRGKNVAVSFVGKVKTASQMIAILLLLYYEPIAGLDTHFIGTWLIYLAALMTVVSMVYYIVQAYNTARKP
ncbi:MAG: CDP-diacylglycerol--glycerol-3-phosphate 3-phosphatidyltransferase [Burkholderiales bacterium]|nr:CDP-diacylglycerol--glycerol-3-phosphate 3-phosphatidyltransferase [Burkholderiales bacterium]